MSVVELGAAKALRIDLGESTVAELMGGDVVVIDQRDEANKLQRVVLTKDNLEGLLTAIL